VLAQSFRWWAAINPLAGVGGVPAGSFITWPVAGGLAWSLGITLAGWQLGSHVRNGPTHGVGPSRATTRCFLRR
jgi:membrane protein DedA with SNARE-associated domain